MADPPTPLSLTDNLHTLALTIAWLAYVVSIVAALAGPFGPYLDWIIVGAVWGVTKPVRETIFGVMDRSGRLTRAKVQAYWSMTIALPADHRRGRRHAIAVWAYSFVFVVAFFAACWTAVVPHELWSERRHQP